MYIYIAISITIYIVIYIAIYIYVYIGGGWDGLPHVHTMRTMHARTHARTSHDEFERRRRRSSTQRLGGGGPIINATPGRRGSKFGSSTQGLIGGVSDHQRKAWEVRGIASGGGDR